MISENALDCKSEGNILGVKSGYRVTFTSAISGIIVSVTSCGEQGNMSRMTLSDRIEIEAGISFHYFLLLQ